MFTDLDKWIRRSMDLRQCSYDEAINHIADVCCIVLGYKPRYWEDYFRNVDAFVALSDLIAA